MGEDQVRERESEAPQRRWRLVAEPPEALGDPIAMCRPGIEALFAFAAGLLEPLAVRVELAWLEREHGDRAGYPPHMEWKLVRRDLPAEMSTAWPVPATLEVVDVVDARAVERFVSRASDQQGPPELFACPMSIGFSTVRARLLDPFAPTATELRLDRREGPASAPIEWLSGAAWISGPQDGFITPPVRPTFRIKPYEQAVEVSVHWTPWSEDDRPGTLAVEAAVARVAALGWELEE
jgi:hypothetical protein